MRPVRIVASSQSQYDERSELWGADRFFRGGALSKTWRSVQGAPSPQLYNSERFGHFTYAIPVADGKYNLRLHFAETSLGPANPLKGGGGDRVFDIYCNGKALLQNFDVIKDARGENRAVDRVFPDLKANAQSKLLLSFVPSSGKIWAFVNAIEVTNGRP